MYASKSIAAYDLKANRCMQLNKQMRLLEYQRSMSLYDCDQRLLSFKN